MSDRLMTVQEAADYLKVHWQTIRSYIEKGIIKASKVGGRIRILESELAGILENREKEKHKLEIEIRFLTQNRRKIEEKLLKMGSKVIYQGHVVDHYYVQNTIKNIEEKNADYESGKGFGLRIREQDNGYTGKITTTLENKRLVTPYQHDTCLEVEMGVESYKEANDLLYSLNMKEFATLDKDRLVYRFGEAKIVIDDIRGYKTGIEVEIMTNEARDKVLPRLHNIAEKIGLDTQKELVDKSVTYLYMQEFARF